MNTIESSQKQLTCHWSLTPRCVKTGGIIEFETGKCCIPCNRVRLQMSQNRFQAKKKARNSTTVGIRFVRKTTRAPPRILTDEEILEETTNLLAGNL